VTLAPGRAALAAGRTVTPSGCAVGLEPGTGRLAMLRWADFEAGVLASAASTAGIVGLCLPAVAAALRRRMAVVIFDLTSEADLRQPVTQLADALGLAVSSVKGTHAIAVGHQLLRRECVFARADHAGLDVLAVSVRRLADTGIRGDALAWVHGCEEADAQIVAGLVALGPAAGVRFLLSTSSGQAVTGSAATGQAATGSAATGRAATGLAATVATSMTEHPDGTCSLIASQQAPGRTDVRYTVVRLRAVSACL